MLILSETYQQRPILGLPTRAPEMTAILYRKGRSMSSSIPSPSKNQPVTIDPGLATSTKAGFECDKELRNMHSFISKYFLLITVLAMPLALTLLT